ncbi:hypothetical protein ACK249_003779 [Pseudomonas aeruginosa]|nr:hypothetical protein [Pseudomonas aeruginosa]
MKLDLTLPNAQSLYEELLQNKTALSAPMKALLDSLEDFCGVNLEWHPTGGRKLPTIRGQGWMVFFNESPTDSDAPETTLWDRELDRHYVLTGDHREAFSRVAPQGFNALFALYLELDQNPNFHNGCTYAPRGAHDTPLRK